jgi:hypothetical protein
VQVDLLCSPMSVVGSDGDQSVAASPTSCHVRLVFVA